MFVLSFFSHPEMNWCNWWADKVQELTNFHSALDRRDCLKIYTHKTHVMLCIRHASVLHFLLSAERCPALPSSHKSLPRLVITWTKTRCTYRVSTVYTVVLSSPHNLLSRLVITWRRTKCTWKFIQYSAIFTTWVTLPTLAIAGEGWSSSKEGSI